MEEKQIYIIFEKLFLEIMESCKLSPISTSIQQHRHIWISKSKLLKDNQFGDFSIISMEFNLSSLFYEPSIEKLMKESRKVCISINVQVKNFNSSTSYLQHI